MIDLTLDDFLIPNLPTYTPIFGTKVQQTTENKGGLSTVQVTEDIMKPFVKQRAITITQSETTTKVECNSRILINGDNVTLSLDDAVAVGIGVTFFSLKDCQIYIMAENKTLDVKADSILSLNWTGSSWKEATWNSEKIWNLTQTIILDNENIEEDTYTYNISVSGVAKYEDGMTLKIKFRNPLQSSQEISSVLIGINGREAKALKVPKNNSFVLMRSHQMTTQMEGKAGFDENYPHRFADNGVMLEMSYDTQEDAWIVNPNQKVMSYSDDSVSYSVKADGLIELFGILNSAKRHLVIFPVKYNLQVCVVGSSAGSTSNACNEYVIRAVNNDSFIFESWDTQAKRWYSIGS